MLALRSQALARAAAPSAARWASTAASSKDKFKVLVVGGGTSVAVHHVESAVFIMSVSCLSPSVRGARAGSGGLNVANQIYNRFKSAGKALNEGDIAILDAAEYHYYQVRTKVIVARAA